METGTRPRKRNSNNYKRRSRSRIAGFCNNDNNHNNAVFGNSFPLINNPHPHLVHPHLPNHPHLPYHAHHRLRLLDIKHLSPTSPQTSLSTFFRSLPSPNTVEWLRCATKLLPNGERGVAVVTSAETLAAVGENSCCPEK